MKLDGKVALITGAASGIGYAIAKRYVEAGGRVVIADLSEDGAAKAAKELAGTEQALGVGMDVSKEDQVNAGVKRAVDAFGTVDILVSNAGIQIVHPICPGFVKTPLVEKQIPEQAQELGISEERVIKEVLLVETVDHKFTTVEDVAEVALFLAAFKTNALTGQSICVSHGWHMS